MHQTVFLCLFSVADCPSPAGHLTSRDDVVEPPTPPATTGTDLDLPLSQKPFSKTRKEGGQLAQTEVGEKEVPCSSPPLLVGSSAKPSSSLSVAVNPAASSNVSRTSGIDRKKGSHRFLEEAKHANSCQNPGPDTVLHSHGAEEEEEDETKFSTLATAERKASDDKPLGVGESTGGDSSPGGQIDQEEEEDRLADWNDEAGEPCCCSYVDRSILWCQHMCQPRTLGVLSAPFSDSLRICLLWSFSRSIWRFRRLFWSSP